MNAEIWLESYMTPTVQHLQITSYTFVGTSMLLHNWPSSHKYCTPQQHLQPANGPFLTQQSRVTLQLAVSQPVCLGFTPSWAHNQTMYVLDDDYGNTVMISVHARTNVPDGTVRMAIFKNHSPCLCA